MDLKTKLRNPRMQQYILEIIFPLAGYYFWDWSLLIIVVFYLLDYLASQLLFFRRLFFIQKHQNIYIWWLLPLSILLFSGVYVGTLKLVSTSLVFVEYKSVKPYDELLLFAKDELWFLFPMILLTYYMMDKMFFFMPRRFMKYKSKQYFTRNIMSNILAILLVAGASYFVGRDNFSDVVIILGIIITKLTYDLFVKKKLLKIDV